MEIIETKMRALHLICIQYDSCTEESFTRKRAYGTNGTSSSWWTNRHGAPRPHWPVKVRNDAGVVSESNLITNLQDLPVIELNFGPEFGVSGLCSSQFQLGKLICYGRSQTASGKCKFLFRLFYGIDVK